MGIDPPAVSPPPAQADIETTSYGIHERAQDKSPQENGRKKQQRIFGIAMLFVIIVAAILIGVFVRKDNSVDPSAPSTNSKTGTAEFNNTDSPTIKPTLLTEGLNTSQFYVSETGPFQVEIPIYSPEHIGVYADEVEAKVGFRQLALFFMNNVVNRNMGVPGFQNVGFGNSGTAFAGGDGAIMEDSLVGRPAAGESQAAPVDASIGLVGDELDSFQTNNQEENVDQADFSKSDGEFIFTAYGDYLLVVRASNGELVVKEQMPLIECADDITGPYPGVPIVDVPEKEEVVEEVVFDGGGDPDSDAEADSKSSFMPPFHYCPKPYIQSLLLSESRLAVVVSGYGNQFRAELTEPPVLNEFLSTHVRLYSTEALDDTGELELLGVKDIHGYYRRGFVINDVAHIATMSSLNTWDWLVFPNERWNPLYQNFSEDEYFQTVQLTGENVVDEFVSRLLAELSMSTGSFPNVANLNLLTDDASGADGFESIIFGEGYANSMVQLTSFDMSQTPAAADRSELEVEITCQFLPTSWGEVYSANDMLIVAGQGYHFDRVLGASEDMTYLFGFSLDGIYTNPAMSGKVPGYLLNPYSIDYVDGLLRVATTIQNRWFVDAVLLAPATPIVAEESVTSQAESEVSPSSEATKEGEVLSLPEDVPEEPSQVVAETVEEVSGGGVTAPTGDIIEIDGKFLFLSACPQDADECFDDESLDVCAELIDRKCSGIFYWSSKCPYELQCLDWFKGSNCPLPGNNNNTQGQPCLDGKNFAACLNLEGQGCENVMVLESCPLQFECDAFEEEPEPDPPIIIDPWTPPPRITKNQIFVLDASDGAEMQIVGNVTMGKPGEGKSFGVYTAL